MTQNRDAVPAALNPALSPGFGRARILSRVMTVVFAIGFLVMLSVALSAVVFVFFPKNSHGVGSGIGLPPGPIIVDFGDMHGWTAVGSMIAVELITVPTLFVLYHMCRLFSCFARGEVFAAKPIANIRQAGLWMTASFFTDIAAVYLLVLCGQKTGFLGALARAAHSFPNALPGLVLMFDGAIFAGISIIIAAYVMAEARRIGDENASIL